MKRLIKNMFWGSLLSLYRDKRSKKEIIEDVLKDLEPSVREEARRVLEEIKGLEIMDREELKTMLRKRRIIK